MLHRHLILPIATFVTAICITACGAAAPAGAPASAPASAPAGAPTAPATSAAPVTGATTAPAACPAQTPSAPAAGGPGGPGLSQTGPLPTAGPPATLASVPAGAVRFQVVPGRSTATFRVREQLAGVSFPSDAVGCTGSVSGQLVLQPSGELVATASRVTVDLRDLKSDDGRRDNFIKSNTMQTSSFPLATFNPVRAAGLPSPLPASGSASFTLTGQMTAHGVTRESTWDVTAKRDGNQLSGVATTSFKFGDFGMSPPRVPLVLSVVDDIRLEVKLEATASS